jgi:Fe-S-cluster containining protein
VSRLGTDAADEVKWLILHGSLDFLGRLSLPCRCSALKSDGSYGIYRERPKVCRAYRAGGPECLAAVRERRTAEEYAMIRGKKDPARIHEVA